MGAHSTPGATGPTGARIVTTTLAIAATSVLGAGTALAHDDSGHHGHGDSHSSTAGEHDGYGADGEADDTVHDTLSDLGMTSWDPTWDSSWDSSWDDEGSEDGQAAGDDVQPAAQQAPAPAPVRPVSSTQPIAAPGSSVPAELPAPGETQTIPIRGTR